MAKVIETIEKDGVLYWVQKVHTQGKTVGFAPTKVRKDLDELLADMEPEVICELACRQLREDSKNAVRPKYNKDKVKPADVLAAIGDGRLTAEMQIKANEMWQEANSAYKNFTEACGKLLGLGAGAIEDVDETQVHWDCVK